MCGIVGFIGDNAVQNVLNGLETLEYRGYDSSGIAVFRSGRIEIIKRRGRLEILRSAVEIDGTLALGHNRWATNGEPTEINAHPHTSGKITVVHNGIIENYRSLKECVFLRNREFVSDTDTEVIAHIIDLMEGHSLVEKVKMALSHLEGSYALAVISEDDPNTIIVARKHSPLVVGVFDSGAVISSDTQAVLPHTNRIIIMEDGDVGVVQANSVTIYNAGDEVYRDPIHVDCNIECALMDGYEHYMLKEIHDQPQVIKNTIRNNNWKKICEDVRKICSASNVSEVLYVACGTSYYAGMIGAMLTEKNSGIRSIAKLSTEFEESSTIINKNTIVIAISQSGETRNTLDAICYAKKTGASVISIVNVIGSSMERETDYTIYTYAGKEVSVASTKSFMGQLCALHMISGIFGLHKTCVPHLYKTKDLILGCADSVCSILSRKEQIESIAYNLSHSESLFVIGRGLGFPIALEGGLKIKEITYIHAEGMCSGEFKHGTLSLISDGTPVIALCSDSMYKKVMSGIMEVKARGAVVVMIVTENDDSDIADEKIYIPKVDDNFYPLLSVVVLQLLAYYMAKKLSRSIDTPKNLAKSVTVD